MLSHFSANSSSFVPSEQQLVMWMTSLKLDPEYGKDAWQKMKVGGMVKKWSGNPAASSFTAPEVDAGIPPLKFSDHKSFEKEFVKLQNAAGTSAIIGTRIIALIEGEFVCLFKALSFHS